MNKNLSVPFPVGAADGLVVVCDAVCNPLSRYVLRHELCFKIARYFGLWRLFQDSTVWGLWFMVYDEGFRV